MAEGSSAEELAAGVRELLAAIDDRDAEAAWLEQHEAQAASRRAELRDPLRDGAGLLLANLDDDPERHALLLDPYRDVEALRHLVIALGVIVCDPANCLVDDPGAARDTLRAFLVDLAGHGYNRG